MLERTFCHIPGVGLGYERRLWDRGVMCWRDCLAAGLTGKRAATIQQAAEQSCRALERGQSGYFGRLLPAREQWRLFRNFRESVAYLDIETTGLGGPDDHVTTAALYDGQTVRHYVYGKNLQRLAVDAGEFSLLVTYNGKCFDLPFLRRQLGVRLDQGHVDLRYVLRALGLRGGLKAAEAELGLGRPGMEHLDGYAAVLLWRLYERTREQRVLETLLAYNVQDVLSLEWLMIWAFNQKLRETPFLQALRLAERPMAQNPFRADPEVVHEVCYWSAAEFSLAAGRD